jgi:hypothetical protein
MRDDSAEILSVPIPNININRCRVYSYKLFFFNLLRHTLRARITNPRNLKFSEITVCYRIFVQQKILVFVTCKRLEVRER